METVLYTKEGDVGIIKLNRPEAYNAINPLLVQELGVLFDEIEKDQTVKVVIIASASDKAFCSGADLKSASSMSMEDTEKHIMAGQALYRKIDNFPKPVVAAINALALGGGLEMSLACDDRVIVDGAKVGNPEAKLGLLPAWGGTQRLTKIVGRGIAAEMILTGGQINAKKALEFGLVSKMVSSVAELIPTAIEMAKALL
ncbi:MAG: enoyl-CoA hydratase/isomerase family protein [Candidatus Hodarchaeota archaeon]